MGLFVHPRTVLTSLMYLLLALLTRITLTKAESGSRSAQQKVSQGRRKQLVSWTKFSSHYCRGRSNSWKMQEIVKKIKSLCKGIYGKITRFKCFTAHGCCMIRMLAICERKWKRWKHYSGKELWNHRHLKIREPLTSRARKKLACIEGKPRLHHRMKSC